MSTEDRISAALATFVEKAQIAGAVALAWRNGRGSQEVAVGWRDIGQQLPMERDTIFRIASLTKPITSTAALMLYEEGRFALSDPISRYAPEFVHMRVLSSVEGSLEDSVPATREITFLDLLTHRSGLTNGGFHTGPIGAAYAAALGMDIDSDRSPDEWIARLAELPLIDQPGRAFHYGASTELLGFLIARMEGRSLREILAARIFGPLGMTDTGFVPPAHKRTRCAKMYGFDASGRLSERAAHPVNGPAFLPLRPEGLTYVSGGAGLWSTTSDYLAFARMFIGEGSVDGVRLLSPQTLRMMTSNALTPQQIDQARIMGWRTFPGQGFGLGVAVVLDPEAAVVHRCKGGVGTVGWPGAYGGWWQADPTEGSVLIFLAHNALDMELASAGIGLAVYGAISQFHALASAQLS